METILYFTLPEEDFACMPMRTFLATLLANVIGKPLIEMLSDPDLINLQIARLVTQKQKIFYKQKRNFLICL